MCGSIPNAATVESASPAGVPEAKTPSQPRWFWAALLGILLVGAVLRILLCDQYLSSNPLSACPIVDAKTYWEWAGRIATGHLGQPQPFFSAPLYPYLLGLLRACDGGLATVYTLQIVLDLATAVLLAWIGRRRFGAPVGLLAAGLFLLLLEPASFSLRVLTSTLQLPLVCLAWLAWIAAQEQPTLGRGLRAGAALGLLSLAYAPALYALPVFGLGWWWSGQRDWAGLGRAACAVVAGLAVISPATIHNYHACGEFIPISAQAGVTFAQGNAPGADGTYTTLPGIAMDREIQNRDALRVYRAATGQTPTWRAVNRFFFRRGLEYWRANPLGVARLLGLKAYWFLTGRNHSEIYVPTAEIAEGLSTRLRFMPLHTAWLIPPALLALAAWARRPKTYLPELVLFGLPLLVVLAFYFSPRYRFPAVPVIVVGCAWVLWQAARWQTRRNWSIGFTLALAMGVGLGFVNQAVGFDRLEPRRAPVFVGLGWAAWQAGRLDEAVGWYRKVLDIDPKYPTITSNLGALFMEMGRAEEGLPYLRQAVNSGPESADAHNALAGALAACGQLDEALEHAQTALRLRPDSADLHNNLALVLEQTGDQAAAREHWETALRLDPAHSQAHLNLGLWLLDRRDPDGALRHFREALRSDPSLVPAHVQVSQILYARGDVRGAIASLQRALELAPADPVIATDLAWYLATTPGLAPADRTTALRLAQQAATAAAHTTPVMLDTLAAALAAVGKFPEAVRTIQQAIALAEKLEVPELAQAFRQRLKLYQAEKPYLAPRRAAPP